MELVSLHATVNIVRRMLQATALLLVAAAFNIMLKVAFNNSVESSTNRMQHVAVLPQWNTAFTPRRVRGPEALTSNLTLFPSDLARPKEAE